MSLAALLKATGAVADTDDDTGTNLPESPATLDAQARAVLEKRQRAMMFAKGTKEGALPQGLARVETPRGVFHFDPEQIDAREIEQASARGRENEVLGLGPASKAEVQARARQNGEAIAAVVERTPAGVEVKAAVATPSTAPAALREMNARKAPESRVQIEPIPEVLSGREKPASGGGLAALLAATGAASDEPEAAPVSGPVAANRPGFFGGVANSAKRGLNQSGQAIDAASLGMASGLADDAAREPERVAAERARDPRPKIEDTVKTWGEAKAPHIYAIALQKWETREAERAERLANNARYAEGVRGSLAPAYGAAIGRRMVEAEALPASEIFQQWQDARGVGDALAVLARHPVEVVANLAANGLTSGAPSLAAGTVGGMAGPAGAAAGAGVGSFAVEYGSKIIEEMQAAGVDFQKPETLAALMAEPERFAAIRAKATARGVPVALFDAVSAGIAGKLITSPARSMLGKVAQGGADRATQAALGGAGEAAGALAAGDQIDGKAVLEEMLGEVGSGAVEIGTGAARASLAPSEAAAARTGLARLLAETAPGSEATAPATAPAEASATAAPLAAEAAPAPAPAEDGGASALGNPADTLAEQINARPPEHWKADLTEATGADADLVAQLGRYAEMTAPRGSQDFATFAERMTERFGDKARAYLPEAWRAANFGQPVADRVAVDNPASLDPAWKRAAKWGRLFWQGSADVLRQAGVNSLADAVDRHVDFADRNLAKAWAIVRPAIAPLQGITRLLSPEVSKETSAQAEAFFKARENGREAEAAQLLASARPEARQLVAAVGLAMDYTGRENRRLGVRVATPEGGARPIGFLGAKAFPRVLREDVAAVLHDPTSNPKLWQEMRAELVARGYITDPTEAVEYLRNATPDETRADYIGGLEKARAQPLPEGWREYRVERIIPRYLAQWADRAAPIEAFGQKLERADRDAFDVALEATPNAELKRYIEETREHAYRVNRLSPSTRAALSNLTGGTTALLLGNPYSTLRNLIGGVAQTNNQFGMLKAFASLREAWQSIPDVEAAGGLKADVADLIFADEGKAAPLQRVAGVALKINGFSAVESFVRSHSWLTARAFLRDALASLRDAPNSRRSLQALAFLRRHGADAEALQAEQLKGPATEAFLRKAVRQAQGGYRYDQCPLFTTGPVGRFIFQFARWGLMATRFHAEHSIKPAVFGELVPVRGADGKTTMQRVRTLGPLLRSPLVAMVAGATTYAVRGALFGIDRTDAEWDEIWKTMDEDEQRGLDLALGRMVNDIVAGSTYGALSDYGATLARAVDQGSFKSPIDPPSVAIAREVGLLAYKHQQQGRLSQQDLRQFADRVLTAYRYDSRLAYGFAEATGAEWDAARRYAAEADRRFALAVGQRFAEETGQARPQGAPGLLPRGNQNSPVYDDLTDALHAGEPEQVRAVVAAALAGSRTTAEQKAQLAQLRTAALSRQPLRPGGRQSEGTQDAFRAWMSRRLTEEQAQRIETAQRRFFLTGQRAGLFTDKDLERYTVAEEVGE